MTFHLNGLSLPSQEALPFVPLLHGSSVPGRHCEPGRLLRRQRRADSPEAKRSHARGEEGPVGPVGSQKEAEKPGGLGRG